MDYEKAYKELVKNFNIVLNLDSIKQNGAVPVEDIVKMIPELKKTEDNSIKEELINFLNTYINAHGCTEMSKWVSWVEKQEKKNNLLNFDEAEKEKNDFVSGQFIECRKSFNEFKELESYWLEYVGDDTYIGRSDNILNQKFHITPRQLFTLFTHQHCPKDNEKQVEKKSYDKFESTEHSYITENSEFFQWIYDRLKYVYNENPNVDYMLSLKERIEDMKKHTNWSEEDKKISNAIYESIDFLCLKSFDFSEDKVCDWLKSLEYRVKLPQLKQEWSEKDSERLLRIHQFIWANRKGDTDEIYQQEQDADWLMSIIPQPNQYDKGYADGYSAAKYNCWKPSKEQMETLKYAASVYVMGETKKNLESLYNDIKNI